MTGYVKISLFCGCNLLGVEFMGNEELTAMFAQKSTKEDLNFIARFFRRFIDAIKKVFGGDKKYRQYVYDAEKLLGAFERAVKVDGNKKSSGVAETRNALNQDFYDEIGEWAKAGKPDGNTFILGSTGNVLQGLGAIENDIYMRGDKVKKILGKHGITLDEIKKIPQILENPTLILKSQFKGGGNKNNTRLVIFGTVKTSNGSPVLTVLDLRPVEDTFVVDDMQKLTSAYIKTTDPVNFIRNSLVVYADKKKAVKLLRSIGFQMPIELQPYTDDYVGSISYFKRSVKIDGKKFSEVFVENANKSSGNTTETRSALSSKSTKTDQTTTQNFKNWFGDWQNNPEKASKIVNADGTPMIMYHGSPEQFTAFDKSKAKASGAYGRGFYFTNSDSHAKQYGNLYAVYLDVKNPLKQGETKVTEGQIRNFLEAVAQNEDDYSIENYGTYDVSEIMKKIESRDAFSVIQDVNATAIGDMVAAAKLWNEVNGTNFDGIVVPTETVVFEPTQIKSATDNIGTFDRNDPDMRHAVSSSPANENSVFDDKQRKDVIRKLSAVAKMNGVTLSVASYCCFTYDFNA